MTTPNSTSAATAPNFKYSKISTHTIVLLKHPTPCCAFTKYNYSMTKLMTCVHGNPTLIFFTPNEDSWT